MQVIKSPPHRYEITFPVSPLGRPALLPFTPVCCCAGDCVYPGSALSIWPAPSRAQKLGVRVHFPNKYDRQIRGAPCWGDMHSGEKLQKEYRMTFFVVVSKVCMAGDRGSLSSFCNWAGNTKSRCYGE